MPIFNMIGRLLPETPMPPSSMVHPTPTLPTRINPTTIILVCWTLLAIFVSITLALQRFPKSRQRIRTASTQEVKPKNSTKPVIPSPSTHQKRKTSAPTGQLSKNPQKATLSPPSAGMKRKQDTTTKEDDILALDQAKKTRKFIHQSSSHAYTIIGNKRKPNTGDDDLLALDQAKKTRKMIDYSTFYSGKVTLNELVHEELLRSAAEHEALMLATALEGAISGLEDDVDFISEWVDEQARLSSEPGLESEDCDDLWAHRIVSGDLSEELADKDLDCLEEILNAF